MHRQESVMRRHFVAGLLVLGVVMSRSSRGADAESVAEDEQLLKAASVDTDGPALLDFFRHLTLSDADRRRIDGLVKQLGDDDFDVREKASAELVSLGPKTMRLLRRMVKDRDPEVARRAQDCVRRLEQGGKTTAPNSHHLPAAAARLLAVRKPDGAAEVLLRYLPFADDESIIEEIELTLAAVALREGRAEPALTKALTAEEPLSRGIAGAALARARAAEHQNAIRKLLLDPDVTVRLRVGLALTFAKDKDAVPVLIDLLGQVPPEQGWLIVDLLSRLAGDKGPAVSLGTDAGSQKKCRDAWAGWWREHGAAFEMPALDGARRLLGYTLITGPDTGKVIELDRDGNVRWQVGGLQSPFEAHVLPGNRLLVAEYSGQVTERNLRGEIVWQKQIPYAMQCQRLANGSTFIVTIHHLIEVDAAGQERVLYQPTQPGTFLLVARKLRDGQIVAVHGDGTCVRLDAAGKEMTRFAVGRVSNNCLHVMPNGHIVVAKFFDGKVTEYDTEGKVVGEITCPSAFSAQRLPNGNTLIACHEPPRVVELDRAGKQVWEYKTDRPWFTSRR
jgi:hypothetical protein